MGVLDDYLVDPNLSLLDKTRIQAQILVPLLRALRSELGERGLTRSFGRPCAAGRNSCSQRSATALRAARAANGPRCIPPWPK